MFAQRWANITQSKALRARIGLNFQGLRDLKSLTLIECYSDLIAWLNHAELDRIAAQDNGAIARHIDNGGSPRQQHSEFTCHNIHSLNRAMSMLGRRDLPKVVLLTHHA
jgi:hypothetical protein